MWGDRVAQKELHAIVTYVDWRQPDKGAFWKHSYIQFGGGRVGKLRNAWDVVRFFFFFSFAFSRGFTVLPFFFFFF